MTAEAIMEGIPARVAVLEERVDTMEEVGSRLVGRLDSIYAILVGLLASVIVSLVGAVAYLASVG